MSEDLFTYLSRTVPPSDYSIPEEHDEYWEDLQQSLSAYIIAGNDLTEEEARFVTILRLNSLINASAEEFRRASGEMLEADVEHSEGVRETLARNAGRYAIGNTMAIIYSMGYELIDDLLEDLLADLFVEEYATENAISFLQDQFDSFQHRSVLLMKAGVIDSETHKLNHEISDIRQKLVHDPETRFRLPMIDDLHDVENIIYAVNSLYEKVHGSPAYEFVEPEL